MTNKLLSLNDYYATSDLALAAAISLWFPIDSIDKTNPNKAEFVFIREEGLDQLIEGFWRNELKVSPLAYFNQLKSIKTRLHD